MKDVACGAVGLVGVLVVVAYYYWAWARVGRDPKKRTVIPLFEPPKGISPAAVRYIWQMGYDNKCLSVGALSASAAGCVEIERDSGDGAYTLRWTGADPSSLSLEEQSLIHSLKTGGGDLSLRRRNHRAIKKTTKRFKRALQHRFGEGFFTHNRLWALPGAALSLLTLLVAGLVAAAYLGVETALVFVIWCFFQTGWTALQSAICWVFVRMWRNVLTFRKPGCEVKVPDFINDAGILAILTILFGLPSAVTIVLPLGAMVYQISLVLVPIILALVVVNAFFYVRLKAYTPEGREIMDGIEGFRMYLGTAEAKEMDLVGAPARTSELFKKYLPYALALDVENRWAEQFADVVESWADLWEVAIPGMPPPEPERRRPSWAEEKPADPPERKTRPKLLVIWSVVLALGVVFALWSLDVIEMATGLGVILAGLISIPFVRATATASVAAWNTVTGRAKRFPEVTGLGDLVGPEYVMACVLPGVAILVAVALLSDPNPPRERGDTEHTVRELAGACESFRKHYGRYPWPEDGRAAIDPVAVARELTGSSGATVNKEGIGFAVGLRHTNPEALARHWSAAFMDGYERPIQYRVDPATGKAVVWSCGENGKDETNDGESPDPAKKPKAHYWYGKGDFGDDVVAGAR
ncbi:MAG: DUF2207 family protein [Planctomycetota bacterium]|jgi:hypothetical protein